LPNVKKIKFVVQTTADRTSGNVIAAARQQGNDELPEILGPLSAPVAAELAKIMGKEGERLSGVAEDGIKGPFTCVIMPGRENEPPPLKDVGDGDLDSFFRDNETPMPKVQPEITQDICLNVDFYRVRAYN
jgi:hypothetical protein